MCIKIVFQWRPYRGEGILATVVKNGYKKNGRWGNANRSLHNQLYSSLTLFLSNNHNITFVPVYRYLFAI